MPELASFSESSRQSALQRFQLLRAHLEDGQPLAAIAREANIPYRTLQYWLERYRTSGLAALARKPRIDRGRRRKLSAALQEAIEGFNGAAVPPSSSRRRRTLANDEIRTQKLKRRVKRLMLDHTQKYFHTPFALPGKIMVNSGQGRLEKS